MASAELSRLRASTLMRSLALESIQVIDTVSNVKGIAVDDYAPWLARITTSCPCSATRAEVVRMSVVGVRLADPSSEGEPGAGLMSSETARQDNWASTLEEANGEEVVSLLPINETGLTHVARCCLGATTTLQTGTAFRLTAVQPSVVNAESAAPQCAF